MYGQHGHRHANTAKRTRHGQWRTAAKQTLVHTRNSSQLKATGKQTSHHIKRHSSKHNLTSPDYKREDVVLIKLAARATQWLHILTDRLVDHCRLPLPGDAHQVDWYATQDDDQAEPCTET